MSNIEETNACGTVECFICHLPNVKSVKILPCTFGHGLCTTNNCLQRFLTETDDEEKPYRCPACRKTLEIQPGTDVEQYMDNLMTRYAGKIQCDYCLWTKSADDMWWCNECFRVLCSKCELTDHQAKQHGKEPFQNMRAVTVCKGYLRAVSRNARKTVDCANRERLATIFGNSLLEAIVAKLNPRNQLLFEKLDRLFGRVKSDTAVFGFTPENSEHLLKTVVKLLKLAGEEKVPDLSENLVEGLACSEEELAEHLVSKFRVRPLPSATLPFPEGSSTPDSVHMASLE